jgi:hypothetical protein
MVARRRNPVVPRRTVRVGGCPVQTTVTARPAVVRRWLHTTLWLNRRRLHTFAAGGGGGGGLTVGLGVQWRTPFRKLPAGVEPRPGTLQLCVGNRCLVFQLARAGAAPRILRRFLADARVTFAGYYVASDCRKLRAHHGLEVASTLELCGGGGGGGTRRTSMADLAGKLLGIRRHGVAEKSMRLGRSRWDAAKLSWEQVRYAATDAYVSCRLGVHLRRGAAVHVADHQDDDESEADYYSDDDVRSTASDQEGSEEPEYLQQRQGGWGRFVGPVERVSGGGGGQREDWEDDHVYDSMCSAVYY